uniref:Uncharacterized protein n=1 Tax=Tetranychus urticae TaxID=32264 RepID=T1L5U1_TETUR
MEVSDEKEPPKKDKKDEDIPKKKKKISKRRKPLSPLPEPDVESEEKELVIDESPAVNSPQNLSLDGNTGKDSLPVRVEATTDGISNQERTVEANEGADSRSDHDTDNYVVKECVMKGCDFSLDSHVNVSFVTHYALCHPGTYKTLKFKVVDIDSKTYKARMSKWNSDQYINTVGGARIP